MGLLGSLTAWTRGSTQKRDAALDALNFVAQQRLMGPSVGSVSVTQDTARRNSAVWACRRLRADLESTLPVDVYRRVQGIQVEAPKSPFLLEPAPDSDWCEWAYATRDSLDGCGNTVGLITSKDALGLPRYVELAPMSDVSATIKSGRVVEWRIAGSKYRPDEVWHEKQFSVPGTPIGLDPVLYAAWSVGGYLSAQKFALDYFGSGGAPSGTLKNVDVPNPTADVLDTMKARFRNATANRDIFVTGSSWEWTPATSEAAAAAFLEEMKYGAADVCRFFGVPADMVDAGTSSSSVTYANVTQRNLQFLIMNMGPAIVRREAYISRKALPQPRYLKLNTDALLRMDPATRAEMLIKQVTGRVLAPSEARELDNRPPFTPEQLAEFALLPGTSTSQPGGQQ